MMYDLSMAPPMIVAAVAALVAVYLWSGDTGRRTRAWDLLQLLFRRNR